MAALGSRPQILYTDATRRRARVIRAASRVGVLAEEGAQAGSAGALEVVEMLPQVGGVLDALYDGQRLVVGAHVALCVVVRVDRRPEDPAPQPRRDGDAEVVELGAAALLDVR